jgi:hypothetical protein
VEGGGVTHSWAGRMASEKYELSARIRKLENFLITPEFETLDKIDCDDLIEQLSHMKAYLDVLTRRYART